MRAEIKKILEARGVPFQRQPGEVRQKRNYVPCTVERLDGFFGGFRDYVDSLFSQGFTVLQIREKIRAKYRVVLSERCLYHYRIHWRQSQRQIERYAEVVQAIVRGLRREGVAIPSFEQVFNRTMPAQISHAGPEPLNGHVALEMAREVLKSDPPEEAGKASKCEKPKESQ